MEWLNNHTEKVDKEETFDEVFEALLTLKEKFNKLKLVAGINKEEIEKLEAEVEEMEEKLSTIRN